MQCVNSLKRLPILTLDIIDVKIQIIEMRKKLMCVCFNCLLAALSICFNCSLKNPRSRGAVAAAVESAASPRLLQPTGLSVVPSLLQFLAVHPAVTREMLQSVRTVVSGAAPATKALLDKFRAKCGRDDLVIKQGYGMTESSPVTLMLPEGAPAGRQTSVGRLVPNTRARVVRPDGADAGPREAGELLVRGPQVMSGYLNNETATRETIDEEGWLHTGDVMYYDDQNYFYIVDRTKELIKVKGNQVSPTELENLVMELPEVADCAVVGIPDERNDELPRAFVVLHPNKKLTEEQIQKHVEPRVVKYKRLAGGVIFLDKIPRNPSGKILRQVLKTWKSEE